MVNIDYLFSWRLLAILKISRQNLYSKTAYSRLKLRIQKPLTPMGVGLGSQPWLTAGRVCPHPRHRRPGLHPPRAALLVAYTSQIALVTCITNLISPKWQGTEAESLPGCYCSELNNTLLVQQWRFPSKQSNRTFNARQSQLFSYSLVHQQFSHYKSKEYNISGRIS